MSKIEKASVGAVINYVDKCRRLDAKINENDKTPFWDGDIFVYKSQSIKDNNFFGRVPVQVKGRTNDDYFFRIKREEALAFKADRGCVFFKANIKKNADGELSATKILYVILIPEKIDELLKQTTKTIKIDLQEVPSDPLVFEKQLYAFAASRNNEKVDNTSPKEIQKLVESFAGLREHLKEIEDRTVRAKLKTYLDSIKNLREDTRDDDTIGWRDSFYFSSREAIDLAINNIEGYDFVYLQFDLAYYLVDQKQYHLAEDFYLKVLKEYRKRFDIVNVAATLNNLGNLHSDLTRYDEAEEEYKEALEIYRELAETNRDAYIVYVATTLNNLAILHKDLTRYDESEKEYKEALMIRRELAKNNRDAYIGDVAMTLNNLGELHRALNHYDEAEEEYNEALDIYRELTKANRDTYIADVAATLNNLAALHYNLTRYDEAEKEYKEALEIRRELAKTNRDAYIGDVATTLNNLAILHKNYTCYDEAEEEYNEALEIYRELTKTNRDAYIGYVAQTLNNLGNLHRIIKRYEDAKTELEEALKIRRKITKTNRDAYIEKVAETLFNITLLQEATNRKVEATETAEKALGIYKELAKDYPQIWDSWVEETERLLEILSK